MFGFIASGNNTAIIITEYHYWFSDQLWVKDPLAGNVKVIDVDQGDTA